MKNVITPSTTARMAWEIEKTYAMPVSSSPEMKMTRNTRKIGLGIMGFADMLVTLGIPYDSEEALKIAGDIMRFINDEAVKASVELAEERVFSLPLKGVSMMCPMAPASAMPPAPPSPPRAR